MHLHADQYYVPQPWTAPFAVNVAWLLDDFTDENGATRVIPGSHRALPDFSEPIETVPVEGPAGSIMVMDGRLWHQTGENRTSSVHRAGVVRLLRPTLDPPADQLERRASGRGRGGVRPVIPRDARARLRPHRHPNRTMTTIDLDRAAADLREDGLCIVPGALDADTLTTARTALYEAAARDRAEGREVRFGLDYAADTTNQRVWNLPNRHPVFCTLAEHPAALALVKGAHRMAGVAVQHQRQHHRSRRR